MGDFLRGHGRGSPHGSLQDTIEAAGTTLSYFVIYLNFFCFHFEQFAMCNSSFSSQAYYNDAQSPVSFFHTSSSRTSRPAYTSLGTSLLSPPCPLPPPLHPTGPLTHVRPPKVYAYFCGFALSLPTSAHSHCFWDRRPWPGRQRSSMRQCWQNWAA